MATGRYRDAGIILHGAAAERRIQRERHLNDPAVLELFTTAANADTHDDGAIVFMHALRGDRVGGRSMDAQRMPKTTHRRR